VHGVRARGACLVTPAESVRATLAAAGYLDETLPVTVAFRVIAAAVLDGASIQRICELLDTHQIALENHPDTAAVAARIVAAVKEAH
jgi:hypothetical protein